jgi:hypothetical protein
MGVALAVLEIIFAVIGVVFALGAPLVGLVDQTREGEIPLVSV